MARQPSNSWWPRVAALLFVLDHMSQVCVYKSLGGMCDAWKYLHFTFTSELFVACNVRHGVTSCAWLCVSPQMFVPLMHLVCGTWFLSYSIRSLIALLCSVVCPGTGQCCEMLTWSVLWMLSCAGCYAMLTCMVLWMLTCAQTSASPALITCLHPQHGEHYIIHSTEHVSIPTAVC